MVLPFDFEYRSSESALISGIWRTSSAGHDCETFLSTAGVQNEIVFTHEQGRMYVTLRGPETKASPAPVPEEAEMMGIILRLGTFIPVLPTRQMVDGGLNLPDVTNQSFMLHGSNWELPTFENVDTFIHRMIREGLLAYEPLIEAALEDQPLPWSPRSIERRFQHVTGVTQGTIRQIQRAHLAQSLLEQGISILDVVDQAGYFDQPHLTRSLRRFIGQTPAQILRQSQAAE